MTLPPSSTTTNGLPSAATALMSASCVPRSAWGRGESDGVRLGVAAGAIAGAGVLLALVLRGQPGDHHDEVGTGRGAGAVGSGSRWRRVLAAAMMPASGPTLLAGSENTRLEPQSPVRTLVVKSREQLIEPLAPELQASWLTVL